MKGNFRFKDSRISRHLLQLKGLAAARLDDEAGVALPPGKLAEQKIQYGDDADNGNDDVDQYIQ